VRDRLIGVLDVQSTELHGFDRGDLITLQTLADQIGIAVEKRAAVRQCRAGRRAAAAERQRLRVTCTMP
jgi:GAF domain-containing protein